MSASVTITVPCVPDRCLNINSRCHWAQVRACAKRLRETAGWAVYAAIDRDVPAGASVAEWARPLEDRERVIMDVEVRWPVGRRVLDDDNCWASLKSLRDGLADVFWEGQDAHIRQGTLTQAVTGEGITIVTLRVDENVAPRTNERGIMASDCLE